MHNKVTRSVTLDWQPRQVPLIAWTLHLHNIHVQTSRQGCFGKRSQPGRGSWIVLHPSVTRFRHLVSPKGR